MCSINAILNYKGTDILDLELIGKMEEATKSRGTRQITQDHNDHRNAIVSFNWLQITDQSKIDLPNGFWDDNGTIVYLNGFISNYRELAEKYEIQMDTTCDIEFLAKFMDKFGENKLGELNGFFAVLYWSPVYQKWSAFTDRYGIKQLYKYDHNGVIYISSEVKGILAVFPDLELNLEAVEDWKCTLGVMNPNTIYKGITRAPKLPFVIPEKIEISYEDAKLKLLQLLNKSRERNEYSGNKGVYLSGGVDSGIIASIMRPDYCFSVDYVDERFSESDLIKKNSTGAHMSIIVNDQLIKKYPRETMKALDDLKAGSCYTNFAIAELASNFVTVVYSGVGGDEFFGGYPHRNDKAVDQSIVRSEMLKILGPYRTLSPETTKNWTKISHFDYDLKFLDAILVVEDRMGGYHTMETRYPLLDNDLVDFALSLPDEYLENKRILKDVSGLHPDVLSGKKKGFSNPGFTNDEWVEFTLNNLKR